MKNKRLFAAAFWMLSAAFVCARAQVHVPMASGILRTGIASSDKDKDKDKKEHTHVGETVPEDMKINGKITVGSLHGKPVLIHIWATWCPPCMASMPAFHRLVDQYAKTDLQVILLDRDHDFAAAHIYLNQQGIKWPDFHDDGKFFKVFGGHGIPATVVIDRDGVVRYHHTGEGLSEKSVGKLERALARSITRPVTPPGQTAETAVDEDPDKP